jgi:hypothetical protein
MEYVAEIYFWFMSVMNIMVFNATFDNISEKW